MFCRRSFPHAILVILILVAGSSAAQEKNPQPDDPGQTVRQLGVMLQNDELRISMAAFKALESLTRVANFEQRPVAKSLVDSFRKEATEWLAENAHEFRQSGTIKALNNRTRGKRYPVSYKVVFKDTEIEARHLKYLAAVDVGYLAFVNVPSIKDQHLICLNDQPRLFSLTLEDTSVTGSGFDEVVMPGLQVLFLTGSPIVDKGFRELTQTRFPALTDIIVVKTDVTKGAIERNQAENPMQVRIRNFR